MEQQNVAFLQYYHYNQIDLLMDCHSDIQHFSGVQNGVLIEAFCEYKFHALC